MTLATGRPLLPALPQLQLSVHCLQQLVLLTQTALLALPLWLPQLRLWRLTACR